MSAFESSVILYGYKAVIVNDQELPLFESSVNL